MTVGPSLVWQGDVVDPRHLIAHRGWYAVAVLIPLLAWVFATAHVASSWDAVRSVAVTPVGERINAGGEDLAVFTDLPQPDREIECVAVGPKKKRTAIPASPVEVVVNSDGSQWTLIGFLDNAGDGFRVRCSPTDDRTDAAIYGYALIDDLQSRSGTGHLIAWGGVVLGLALAAVTTWARLTRPVTRSRGRDS